MLSTLVELKDVAERIYKDVQQSKKSAIKADYNEVKDYLANSNNGDYPLFDEAVSLACIVGDTATLKALDEESFMPKNASKKEVLFSLGLLISRIEKELKARGLCPECGGDLETHRRFYGDSGYEFSINCTRCGYSQEV